MFFVDPHHRNPTLSLTGWLHVVLLAGALAGLLIDDRLVMGINPWIKPIKFCLSVTFYVWSLGWLLAYLPATDTEKVRWLSLGVSLTMVIEIACIFLQAARGTTSHFNITSPFNGFVFSLMGIAILVNTALNLWALWLTWAHALSVGPAIAWGIRLGLLLFILGAVEGGVMIRQMGHTVGAPDGGPGLPGLNWSIRHGDLRVPHFLGIHALQALPALGWLLTRLGIAAAPAVSIQVMAAIGWGLLATFALVRALRATPVWAWGG